MYVEENVNHLFIKVKINTQNEQSKKIKKKFGKHHNKLLLFFWTGYKCSRSISLLHLFFKLTTKIIETFCCFISFFNSQQYPQTYHQYCSPRFDIYFAEQNLNLVLQVKCWLYLLAGNLCYLNETRKYLYYICVECIYLGKIKIN